MKLFDNLLSRKGIFLLWLWLLATASFPTTQAAEAASNNNNNFNVEPRTGITFEPKQGRAKLEKIGLRTKGPIKVYAVAQYAKHIFVLKMAYTVNAEKLSGALMDALKPRCKSLGCTDQVNDFKQFVMSALPNGAKTGTTLVFNTGGGKVTLSVNGKAAGKIVGKAVAQAFAGIYSDANAVCPMKPVRNASSDDGMDDEMIGTIGIMALTTLLLLLFLTKPDPTVRVNDLFLYPVKSCAEQTVQEAVVTPLGFDGDRIAMVVDKDGQCCTSRDRNQALLFHVYPEVDTDTQTLTLRAPVKAFYDLQLDLNKSAPSAKVHHNEYGKPLRLRDYGNVAATWMETATGIIGCRLTGLVGADDYTRAVQVNPGQGQVVPVANAPVSLADEAPFLLTNLASLEDLNARLRVQGKDEVDMRRFRPNIVITGQQFKPWQEDTWKKIRIGGQVEFFVWQSCGRCIMTTIDRDSLSRNTTEPLKTLATFRENEQGQRNFGMHLVPDPATLPSNGDVDNLIQVGDTLEVLEYDETRLKEWEAQFGG